MLFKACVSFSISFLNWKIIIFQCCSGFFCTKAWISPQYTYASYCAVNHLLLLFHCSTPFLNVSCMISIYFAEMFDHLYYCYSQFIFSDTFYFLFNYVLCYFTLFLCLQHILYCLHICLSHYVNGLFFLGYRVVVLASSLCSEWISVV